MKNSKFDGIDQKTQGVMMYIDPTSIRRPEFNRSAASFNDSDYEALLTSIKAAGGNTTAIEVIRTNETDYTYELISGERRLQCCVELEIPVFAAIIATANAKDILKKRILENCYRKKHSPVELGMICNDAIEKQIVRSVSDFSIQMGLDKSQVHKAMRSTTINKEVRGVFDAAGGMTYAQVDTLLKLNHNHEPELLQAVQIVKDNGGTLKANEVFKRIKQQVAELLAKDEEQEGSQKSIVERFHSSQPKPISKDDRDVGTLVHGTDGHLKITINQEVDKRTVEAIHDAVTKELARRRNRKASEQNSQNAKEA
jgi:ParB/RepB/Spo0J family partition protein